MALYPLHISHTTSKTAITHIVSSGSKFMQPRRETSSSSFTTCSAVRLFANISNALWMRAVDAAIVSACKFAIESNESIVERRSEIRYLWFGSILFFFFFRCVPQFRHSKFSFYYSFWFYSSCTPFPSRFHFRSPHVAEHFFRRGEFYVFFVYTYMGFMIDEVLTKASFSMRLFELVAFA